MDGCRIGVRDKTVVVVGDKTDGEGSGILRREAAAVVMGLPRRIVKGKQKKKKKQMQHNMEAVQR